MLEELVESANRLHDTLERVRQEEKKFNDKIIFEIERMLWESYRMMNDIKLIKEYCS